MKWNRESLRRLGWGAVVVLVSWPMVSCGDSHNDLGGPDGPEPPVDQGISPSAGCTDGVLGSGALYRVCFPEGWNGDLVLFAHGYVAPQQPLAIPDEKVGGEAASTLLKAGSASELT